MPRASNPIRGLGGAEHWEALTDPLLHSTLEHPHVDEAGLAQNVRRTGRALLCASDGNEEMPARTLELVEATREILDRDVDDALQTAERAGELVGTSHVEHRGADRAATASPAGHAVRSCEVFAAGSR